MLRILLAVLVATWSLQAALIDIIPSTRVADDKVRLGDLFTGIDGHTEKIVEKAPIPGKAKTYDYNELKEIAKKFDIKWEPLLDTARAVVLRASFRMDPYKLHELIFEALKKKHPKLFPSENVGIQLTNGKDDIYIPREKKIDIQPGEISLNDQQTRFTIKLKTPYKTYEVEGYLVHQRAVPVLRHSMRRGDIINPVDTELMTVSVKELGRAQIIDRSELLGKTIKVGEIKPFKPIYEHEVAWQFMVRNGDTLRMFPCTKESHEEIPGTALMNGMRDDLILVRNDNTGEIQEAHIISPSEVRLINVLPVSEIKPASGESQQKPAEEDLLI